MDDDVEIIPAEKAESHKVQLVKCQLETLMQLYKERGSNLQCNFQVAAARVRMAFVEKRREGTDFFIFVTVSPVN